MLGPSRTPAQPRSGLGYSRQSLRPRETNEGAQPDTAPALGTRVVERRRARLRPTSQFAYFALLAYFVVEYTRPGIYLPFLDTLRVNSVIPLLAFGLAVFAQSGRPARAIVNQPISRWMIFFLALFVVQFFTSDVKLYVWDRLTAVLGYLFVYFAILRNATTVSRFKGIFAVIVGVHVLMLLMHPNVVLEPEKRHYIGGTFLGDGNDFAWSACIAAPMALFLFRNATSPAWRWAWLAAVLLLILAVVGTQSRGGSIALGIGALWFVWRSRRRLAAMAWLAAAVVVVLLFAPPAYFERMQSVATYKEDGSAQGRILAWNSALRMALDHPLVGVGAGHFSVKFGVEYRPPGVGRTEMPWLNAHSIYFVALGEFGFSGIVFLASVIALAFLGAGRAARRFATARSPPGSDVRELAIAVQCSVIGFAVAGMFLSGLYYPHLYLVAALSVGANLLAREAARVTAAPEVPAASGFGPRFVESSGHPTRRQT